MEILLLSTDIAVWFEETAMPYIITFATTLGALLTALMPILAAVKKLKRNSDRLTKTNSSLIAENALIAEENSRYRHKIASMEQDTAQIKAMLRIALLNDPHLVRNGYANEIAAVLGETADEEKTKEEAEGIANEKGEENELEE